MKLFNEQLNEVHIFTSLKIPPSEIDELYHLFVKIGISEKVATDLSFEFGKNYTEFYKGDKEFFVFEHICDTFNQIRVEKLHDYARINNKITILDLNSFTNRRFNVWMKENSIFEEESSNDLSSVSTSPLNDFDDISIAS